MTKPRVQTPPRTCQRCGTTYERTNGISPGQFARSRFCSRSCTAAARGFQPSVERQGHVIEDVEWLLGTDTPESIANRLGYANLRNLLDLLRRWERRDLAERLIRDREQVSA